MRCIYSLFRRRPYFTSHIFIVNKKILRVKKLTHNINFCLIASVTKSFVLTCSCFIGVYQIKFQIPNPNTWYETKRRYLNYSILFEIEIFELIYSVLKIVCQASIAPIAMKLGISFECWPILYIWVYFGKNFRLYRVVQKGWRHNFFFNCTLNVCLHIFLIFSSFPQCHLICSSGLRVINLKKSKIALHS